MKTLIFDFDGTIADTKESIIRTIQATLLRLDYPEADESAIKNYIGLPIKDTFVKVAHLPENLLEEAIGIYRTLYNEISLATVTLFPGVKSTLKILDSRGLIITVASSKGKKALESLLHRLEISQYISLILGEEDVINKKPAPDMALLIMEKTNSYPHETMMIGDTVFDIAMGKSAGCLCCGVTYGNHTKEQLEEENPEYIIDSFSGLLDIIG